MSDTLSFLHAVLPATGPYVVASIGSYTTHLIASTIAEVEQLGWAQTTRNRDAYFLIGSVNDGTITKGLRAATNICALRALRVDLDCGEGKPYPDQAAAAAAHQRSVSARLLARRQMVHLDQFASESGGPVQHAEL